MNESPISDPILIADDDLSVLTAVKGLLAMEGYAVRTAKDGREARRILEREPIALLLADLDMPYASGIDLLQHIRDRQIQTPVIIITGKGSIDTAVQAIKTGAYDYLTKPVDARRLRAVIPKALELYALRRSHNRLQQRLQELSGFDELIGEDPAMRQVYHRIEAVADTLATVLITGESGTGKELVARAIHRRSSRRQQPFVAINCSALPREILENELFGHEKGAFTGALQEKAGCFELAHQGSLFLDEIGDMPPDTQVKLLRVLEERSYRRLGGKAEITVDVRVIAATNRDLRRAMAEHTFRPDLYYRLNVIEIHLPALRDRIGDIPLLLDHFVDVYCRKHGKALRGLDAQELQTLLRYPWPGNVRELRNAVERAVVLGTGPTLDAASLLPDDGGQTDLTSNVHLPLDKLDEIEKNAILAALRLEKGDKPRAAQRLGISLKTLYNKLHRYNRPNDKSL